MVYIKPKKAEYDGDLNLLNAIVDNLDHMGRGHVVPQDGGWDVPSELADLYKKFKSQDADPDVVAEQIREDPEEAASEVDESDEDSESDESDEDPEDDEVTELVDDDNDPATPPVPVKRRPGRPRKNPEPEEVA